MNRSLILLAAFAAFLAGKSNATAQEASYTAELRFVRDLRAPHRRTPGTEHAWQALEITIAKITR